jgi:hypothetical protein
LIISLLVSILSIYCALLGFLDKNLYGNIIETGVFKYSFLPGTISQDFVAIVSSILMIFLVILYARKEDGRWIISIIGLLSYYFYGYGTYVISGLYTSVYLIYMLIFTLSVLGMIIGISGFEGFYIKILFLYKWVRICSIVFLSIIVTIFMSKWIVDVHSYTRRNIIPDFYAIYILDLCFILPLFIVIIYILIKNIQFSYIVLGIALMKTTTLILSVTIGSFISIKLELATQDDITMMPIYFAVTAISLFLYIFYCNNIKKLR